MVAGENYWMDVHLDRITGDPGRNFYKLFTIRNKSIITLGVAAQDTTDTLPDACHPIPDTGTYSFAIGDTFHVTAYDTIGDFAFVHWQCSGDSQYNNDTASSLNISYSCEQTRDLALTAIYKRMYRDTINFGSYEHAHPQIFADYVDSLSPTKYVVSGPHNSTFSIVMIPDSGYYVDSITEIPQGGSALTFMSYNITLPITNVPYNIDPYPHTGGGDVCTTYQVCTNAVIDNWDAGVDDYNNRGFTIPNPVLNNVVSITFTPPVNGSCAPNPPGQQPGWLTVNVNILPNYKTANSNWRISKIVISNSAGITNAYYYFQYPCTGPTQSCTLPVAANDCPTTLTVYVAPTRYYLFTEYTMTDGSQIPADVNINLDDMSSYRWFYDWNDHRCRLVTTTSDNNGTHVTRIWEEYCNDPVVLMPAFNSPESFSNWAAGQWTQTCPQPPTYMCPPVGWAQNGNYSVPTPNNTSPYIVTMTSNVHVKALFSAPLLLLDVGYTQGNNNSTITWYSVYPYNAVPSVVKNVTLEETNPITTTDVYFKFNKPVDQTTISNNISFNDISGIASVTGASIRLMDSHTLQSYPSTHVDLSGNSSSPAILKFKLYNSQNLGVVKYETFNSTLKNGL
ncbi:MAG TPA: hypothetical protein VFA55_08730, partial [Candidatus Kapabacteria bacterium]|nr:hypothetical protein [Candidatus Kapabacteria bacterium]